MRALFIKTIAVLGLCGCGGNSYHTNTSAAKVYYSTLEDLTIAVRSITIGMASPPVDFLHPIYLVPDESFYSGCENISSVGGAEACMVAREHSVQVAIHQWLDY